MVVSRNTLQCGQFVWKSRGRLLVLPESMVQVLICRIQGKTQKKNFLLELCKMDVPESNSKLSRCFYLDVVVFDSAHLPFSLRPGEVT